MSKAQGSCAQIAGIGHGQTMIKILLVMHIILVIMIDRVSMIRYNKGVG